MAKDFELKVKFDGSDIKKGVEQTLAQIKSLDKEKASIIIDLKKEQLQADFQKIKEDFNQLSQTGIRPITFTVDKQKLEDSIAQVQENLKNLSSQKITPEIKIEREKLNAELGGLQTDLKKLEATKTKAEIELQKEKAIADLAGIKGELKKLDKVKIDIEVPKNTALELQAISQAFSQIGGVLSQLKNDAVAAFKEFDAAKVKLSTIGEAGKALGGELQGLSKELGYQVSATDLAKSGYSSLSGGFDKAGDSVKILKAATVGAVGGFSDADTVTKGLVATLNSYSLGADKASEVVDKFASVQQNGLITIDEYTKQISKLAPLANSAGVKLDELNGFIATATAKGVPAEQAFGGLRQAIASTLKPSSEATELARSLGIQFDAQALKTKGLSGIIGELNAKGLDSAQNLTVLFGSVEALGAITPSTQAGFANLTKNISASANSAGTAAKNFDTVSNSVGGRAKALQIELEQSLAQFGEKILAVTNPVVAGTTAIVRAFNALPGPVQSAIAIFVGGGAAVAAFGAAIATINAIATPTLAGLTLLSGGLTGLNTALAANVSLAGLASAGEAALGVASGIAAGEITLASIATNALSVATGIFTATVAPAIAVIALLAAGYKAIEFVRYTKDLEELNDALDTNTKTAQTTGNETFKLADKLKSLAAARDAGKGDPAKEKAYLDISKQQLATLERLKKEQQDLAAIASDPSQKQAALNLAKDYEIQSTALNGQVSNLQKINIAKAEGIRLSKDEQKELAKIAKDKAEIDRSSLAKKQNEGRKETEKKVEKVVETKRDKALSDLKIKEEQEIADFKLKQENILSEKKRAFERSISDFKDARELQIQDKKIAFEKTQKDREFAFQKTQQSQADVFQKKQETQADAFRKTQEAADQVYQKKKQDAQKAFESSLSGAKGLIDRESAISKANPKEAEKLKKQFEGEDRISQQVLSTNVDTKSSKSQFADQAKQIAGVGQIKTEEDAAKVKFALAAIEEKAKAQFAEQERAKDKAYEDSKKAAEKVFKDGQQVSEKAFKDTQQLAEKAFKDQLDVEKITFERTVVAPAKKVLEKEIEAQKVAFEQTVIQPLKLKQEADLAIFKQGEDAKSQALKLKFEGELEALRTQSKLKEIDLDAIAQKDKLDREAIFKEEQRALDVKNATQVAGILSAAQLKQAGLDVAVGGLDIPKFSSGIENFGGGLAYVHAGEVLMNLSSGTSVIPANKVSNTSKPETTNNYYNVTSSKDPNQLLSEAAEQTALRSQQRSGV